MLCKNFLATIYQYSLIGGQLRLNIIWFRSDLRTSDNPALYSATKTNPNGVRAVFIITERQWQQHDWGTNKIGFVLANLIELHKDLAKLNIQLDLLACDSFAEVPQTLSNYAKKLKAIDIYFNYEYELNETLRDQAAATALHKLNIQTHGFHDQCLIAPGTIINKQQNTYTVFTPFKKTCYLYLQDHPIKLIPAPKKQDISNITTAKIQLDKALTGYIDNPILRLWPAGSNAARRRLSKFCNDHISDYKVQRDFPALDGTSTLSAYLAVGAISVRECYLEAILHNDNQFVEGNAGVVCWISELIWRDFYRNIIVAYPEICKGNNFNRKYDKLRWQKASAQLQKWQTGQTGIPIIDAAMRQLVQTGWMHNRLRMIVAMFLSKNLLVDWRHGEKFFCQHLVDLDFSSNNGGWQWSASTGTDAVPYFRVFNPLTQSIKFDPQGKFIKEYCPELKTLDAHSIHDPSSKLSPQELAKLNYPEIMVDLKATRQRAIQAFSSC